MSWAVEEWKDGLPMKALQKIHELESQLDKQKKERQQRQLQLESLEASCQRQKQKADVEKNEASALKRENQSLIELCANLEKSKQKITHDHQLKESQVYFLDGQLSASKKQIERMEQDLKRYESEKSQQTLMAVDLLPGGTPKKPSFPPSSPFQHHNDTKFEELQQKYHREVEERKKLEAELKSLQIKMLHPSLPQSTMSHREIARHQSSSSVFSWHQEQTPGCLSTSTPGTPLKRVYSSSHFPWEQEGTPSKQMFRTEEKDSFSENLQPNDHIRMHNQELRSKVNELELRLQVQEKDLKNNLNKLQETQIQLEKVQLELAEKDKALHKSRDELMRTTAQFDQTAAKCESLEQKVKNLSEELGCQRQNAESARCSMEQKMKAKDKEYQGELLRQQHSLQMLDQECIQVKAKLNQELQQSKNDFNALQMELDKATAARKHLEKEADDFKQIQCRAEQALQANQLKENDLQNKIEELKKERNQYDQKFDQKSREAHQLEEERKATKQFLKQRQHLAEELTDTNISQKAKLHIAQETLQKQDSAFSLENLSKTTGSLEKESNSVKDLLKRKGIDDEEIINELINLEENIEALQNIIEQKVKDYEELNKEKTRLSDYKLEMKQSTIQLTFEREELLGKIEVLEKSIETQQEVVKSLETEKETLYLQILDRNKVIENKCVELKLQKQTFVELQQKAEYPDQKYRKEEENVSCKISQFMRQSEEMEHSTLTNQVSSLELSLQAEKQLNTELQRQVEELLKNQTEREKPELRNSLKEKDGELNKAQVHLELFQMELDDKVAFKESSNETMQLGGSFLNETTVGECELENAAWSDFQAVKDLETEKWQPRKVSENEQSKPECIAAAQLLKEELENLVNQINLLKQEKSVLYGEFMDVQNKKNELGIQLHHPGNEPLYFELDDYCDERKANSEHGKFPNQEMASQLAKLKEHLCSLQREHELLNGQYISMMSQMSQLQSSYGKLKTENAILLKKLNPSNSDEMLVSSCTKVELKLSESFQCSQQEKPNSPVSAEDSLTCTFDKIENTTIDSYAVLQHFKEIGLEDKPDTSLFEHHLNSVLDYTIGQETFPPTEADLESKVKTLEPFDQTDDKSIKGKEQFPTRESAQFKELHELKQAIESNRIELYSLREQHLSEKEKWQQSLRELTREMETKLAAEKQQSEYLSQELETARLELQCLDLSARSMLFPDGDDTLLTNFRPEIHGMHQQDAYENISTHKDDSVCEDLTMNLENCSTALTLKKPITPKECNTSQENNIESSNFSSECITITDKSCVAPTFGQEYRVIIDQLQGRQQQIWSEKDTEEKKARVDTLLIEINELYLRLDSDLVIQAAKISENLELEKKVLEFEHENKHLVERMASLSSDNQQLSCSVMDLRKNLDSITSQLESCEVQPSNDREMLNISEKVRVDLNEKFLQTENELKRTKSEKVNIENHALAMEADIEELLVKNQHLQKESEYKLKLISSLEEQITVITADRNRLNQELCSLTEGQEELDQMHQKLKEKVKELESWKVDSTAFIKILEGEVKTQKSVFQVTQSGVDQLSMENSNVIQLQNQVREVNDEKEIIVKASEALKNKISELENENVRLGKSLECILTEKSEILTRLSSTQGEVAHMQSVMETLKERIESDEKKMQIMVEKLKESERKADSLQDKIESLQRDIEMSEDNLENMIVQTETSKEESDNLKTLNVDLAEKLKELDLECGVLRERNEELKTELQQASEKVSELKSSQSTITDILEKHEEEKVKIIEESKSLVSSLQTQLKCLDEERLEKHNLKQEYEKNAMMLALQQEELQSQVGQLLGERDVLIRTSSDFQTKLSETEAENSRLSQSLKFALTENGEIVSRLNSTQEEVSQMRSGIEKLKLRMESDEKKKQHLIEKLKQSEKKTISLNAKIDSLERDLKISEENLKSMVLQVESAKDAAVLKGVETENLKLHALEVENVELNKKLHQTCEKVSELETSQLLFTETLEKHEQEKAKLLEESSTSVLSLQTQLNHLQEEVIEKDNLIQLNQQFERNAEMQLLLKEELQRQVRQLSEEKECILSESEMLKTNLSESESEIARLSKAFECLLIEKGALESSLTSSQEEVACMKNTIEDLKIQIQLHEKENQDLTEQLMQSERKTDSLQDKIESLERNTAMSEENLEDMIIQVETSKEEAENSKALNEDMMKKLKDSDFELDAVRAKYQCLNKELQLSQEKISNFETSQSNISEILQQHEQEKVKMLDESASLVSSLQTQLKDLKKQLEERDHILHLKQEYENNAEMQLQLMEELQHHARQLNEERELLLQTSETLKTKLSESESEITRLSNYLQCVLTEKGEIESRLISTQEEIAHMQSCVEDLKLHIESNAKNNQDMMEKVKQSERKADSLQDKIESLERNLLMSEEHLENMIIQAETSKEEAEHLKALKEDMTKKQKHLNCELDAIRAKNEGLSKELQQSREKCSELEASQSNVSEIIVLYEQEKVKMLEESKSLVSSLETHLKDLNKHQEERDSLLYLKQEYEKNAEMQILQMEELQQQVRQLHKEQELLLQTSETLQTKLTGSESEITRLSKALECLLTEKGELESKLNSSREEVAQMKSIIGNLKIDRESDEKENQYMIEKLHACEQKADSLQDKIGSLERDLQMSEINLENMIIQTQNYKEEAENVKALKDDMTEKRRHLDLELNSLREKYDVVNKELKQSQEKVSELEVFQATISENLKKSKEENIKIGEESKSLVLSLQTQLENVNGKIVLLYKEQETVTLKEQDMARQLTCLEQDKINLMEKLKEAQSNNNNLQLLNEECTQKLVEYKQKMNEKIQESNMLQQQITDAEQWKEKLSSNVEVERENCNREKAGLQKLIDELEQKIKAMSVENEALKDTIQAQQMSLLNVEKEITASKSENSALVAKVAELTEDCSSLKNRLSTVNQKFESIQEEFTTERNTLVEKLQCIKQNEESIKIQLDLVTSEKSELKKSFDSSQKELEHQIKKLKEEIADYQCRIQEINVHHGTVVRNLQKQHAVEIQTYQEKLASVETSLSAQKLEVPILKSSKDELNESLNHANKKLEEFNQMKVEKLKSTLAQLQKENKATRGKLDLFMKSYKQLEQEKEKLHRHIAEQEELLTNLKQSKKHNDEMKNSLKTLKSELEELQAYADEKTRESEETIEKYCGLMINQHKLTEANEMLTNRVDFLSAQLKKDSVTSPLPSAKSCDKTSTKEKRVSKVPATLNAKRPRDVESKQDDKEPKTATLHNVPKRVKSKINSDLLHRTAASKDAEYELEGLPSVVQRGFSDIPRETPKSPYVMRRTALRASPRLAAKKASPVDPSSLQKGMFDTLPDIFKPTAGPSRSQKHNDIQRVQAASEMESVDSLLSPLSTHNNIEKKTLQSPKDSMKTQKGRRSRSSTKLSQHSTEEENCKVQ